MLMVIGSLCVAVIFGNVILLTECACHPSKPRPHAHAASARRTNGHSSLTDPLRGPHSRTPLAGPTTLRTAASGSAWRTWPSTPASTACPRTSTPASRAARGPFGRSPAAPAAPGSRELSPSCPEALGRRCWCFSRGGRWSGVRCSPRAGPGWSRRWRVLWNPRRASTHPPTHPRRAYPRACLPRRQCHQCSALAAASPLRRGAESCCVASPQVFPDGACVVAEGDVGGEMFFVRSGSLRVTRLGLQLARLKGASATGALSAFTNASAVLCACCVCAGPLCAALRGTARTTVPAPLHTRLSNQLPATHYPLPIPTTHRSRRLLR